MAISITVAIAVSSSSAYLCLRSHLEVLSYLIGLHGGHQYLEAMQMLLMRHFLITSYGRPVMQLSRTVAPNCFTMKCHSQMKCLVYLILKWPQEHLSVIRGLVLLENCL